MFCWNCGSKAPEFARFCMNCGAELLKANDTASENAVTTAKEAPIPVEQPPIQFTIKGNSLNFSPSIQEYTSRKKKFQKPLQAFIRAEAQTTREKFESLTRENIDESVDLLSEFGAISLSKMVNIVHQSLLQEKVYNVSKGEIENICQNTAPNFLNQYEAFFEKYLKIVANDNELKEYRNQQRAGRSHWQGGGFGIKGAVKGAATAGALNFGTGLIRSIGDSFTNSADRAKIYKQKVELLQSADWIGNLEEALMRDADCIFGVYADFLAKYAGLAIPNLDFQLSQVYFDNANATSNKNEKVALLTKSIQAYPYSLRPYKALFHLLRQLDEDVLEVFEYFSCDTDFLEEQIFENFLQKLEQLPEDTYPNIDKKIELLKQHLLYLNSMKQNHSLFKSYSMKFRKELFNDLSRLKTKRLTADDGFQAKSIEELDIYLKEIAEFSDYRNEISSKLVPLERQEELIKMAEARNFQTSALKNELNTWKNKCEKSRQIWGSYPRSFENYFAHRWHGDPEKIFALLPPLIQKKLIQLPYSPLLKPLSMYQTHVFRGEVSLSRADAYIVTLNFYILVAVPEFSTMYTILTRQLKRVAVKGTSALLFYRDDTNYDEVPFSFLTDSSANLAKYINSLNATLTTARDNQAHNCCPACSAPLVPGAAFCGECRYKVEN